MKFKVGDIIKDISNASLTKYEVLECNPKGYANYKLQDLTKYKDYTPVPINATIDIVDKHAILVSKLEKALT